jgi:hypothetical protein
MAEQRSFSEYFYKLDAKSRVRYEEKVSCIAKEDPYLLKGNDFTDNASLLPDFMVSVADGAAASRGLVFSWLQGYSSPSVQLSRHCSIFA